MKSKPRQQRIIIITIIVFIFLAVLLIALDWNEVSRIVGKADWQLTLIALMFTLISDFCLSWGYVLVNRAFGIRIGWGELLGVGFCVYCSKQHTRLLWCSRAFHTSCADKTTRGCRWRNHGRVNFSFVSQQYDDAHITRGGPHLAPCQPYTVRSRCYQLWSGCRHPRFLRGSCHGYDSRTPGKSSDIKYC